MNEFENDIQNDTIDVDAVSDKKFVHIDKSKRIFDIVYLALCSAFYARNVVHRLQLFAAYRQRFGNSCGRTYICARACKEQRRTVYVDCLYGVHMRSFRVLSHLGRGELRQKPLVQFGACALPRVACDAGLCVRQVYHKENRSQNHLRGMLFPYGRHGDSVRFLYELALPSNR